tara:strand:+ start:13947 stop:14585 length:639 start_codon:yes stop_codon:yes gene_type:complete
MNFKPYDILLFSGEGLISKVIQRGTGSEWSHVGIVVPNGDKLVLLESTTLSDLPSIDFGVPIKGVTRVDLDKRIAAYEGKVAHRSIEGERPADANATLNLFLQKFNGRPYETNQIELISSALDRTGLLTNQPDMSSVFCSELVAYLLNSVGILKITSSANEYTPADFAEGGNAVLSGDRFQWGPTTVLGPRAKDTEEKPHWISKLLRFCKLD